MCVIALSQRHGVAWCKFNGHETDCVAVAIRHEDAAQTEGTVAIPLGTEWTGKRCGEAILKALRAVASDGCNIASGDIEASNAVIIGVSNDQR